MTLTTSLDLPTSPQVPIGHTADGQLLTVDGRILLAGDAGTGKTVLAARITAADTARWVIHDRHRDRTYPVADWRTTYPAGATKMLDTAWWLAQTPDQPRGSRIRLTIDDTYLLDTLTHPVLGGTTPEDLAMVDAAGIDVTFVVTQPDPPRQLLDSFPTQVLFRHRGRCPWPDLADTLSGLPDHTALLVRPTTAPIVVTIPAESLLTWQA
ncbi:hypothetical protein Ga0074812_1484 [Parafrankia irregularis]|uniref:AAA domain-containing protein n=1 Tax=Parafrankia irregularis TaxID=795642 RepID=A0A0S4QZW4_9ACTN|nr:MULTISPECIES: hypothetical protein [Parafrankia]MBE3206784.1 hypothetical protein [Parafrankia sp. CH37]CUU60804.1 hypothetical protein Ga0074812_1484 [Parafrankia irregularis]